MHEHVTDVFVQRAKAEGWRSRAVFKLMEIDDRDHLIRPGETIVDLGAAPGGWSQLAVQRLRGNGRIVALDLLEMAPLPGVDFIRGDFGDAETLARLETLLAGERAGLVLSDMAPNISGIAVADQARMMDLAEMALDFVLCWLKMDGSFLIKMFQGYGYEDFVRTMRGHFRSVMTRKPEASRDRSAEVYLLGKGLKTVGKRLENG